MFGGGKRTKKKGGELCISAQRQLEADLKKLKRLKGQRTGLVNKLARATNEGERKRAKIKLDLLDRDIRNLEASTR